MTTEKNTDPNKDKKNKVPAAFLFWKLMASLTKKNSANSSKIKK